MTLIARGHSPVEETAGPATLADRAGRPAREPVWRTASPLRRRQQRIVVIIPAHNEAASIGRTIESLWWQSISPGDIVVACDNCTDDTARVAASLGATVLETVGNRHRKAGALNQALARALPHLGRDDLVLTIDADSRLHPDWIGRASRELARAPEADAVCGIYRGDDGHGLLGQLQRNEYTRAVRSVGRMSRVRVLSGCGTLFRVAALQAVAASRGKALPGDPGVFFHTGSITEDYEMTLALKTLGFRCLCSVNASAVTEVMPTVADLFRQRIRWQRGSLNDLRRYGLTSATWRDWLVQAAWYISYAVILMCWAAIAWTLVAGAPFSAPWAWTVLAVSVAERVWTVRKVGWKGVALALLVVPELLYGLFDMGYLAAAAIGEIGHRKVSWNHVTARGR